MEQALFYQNHGQNVDCGLCAHRCMIKPGRRGLCGVRENREGTLVTLVYGKLSAEHIDPVEKKPLFHFLPGTLTYSIATVGCNFKCLHCQNYSLSQAKADSAELTSIKRSPEELALTAMHNGCRSVSYTYVEPTIFFEFAYDCCVAAREQGLKNIFVSNGYMTHEAAQMLVPVLDAINIDVKSFSAEFYRSVCGANIDQVLENVRYFRENGVWVEVTTLLIPGLNDNDDEIRAIGEFIAGIDPDIPWHISGFRPTYKMLDRPPTPASRLLSARLIGLACGLKHVYVGNIHGNGGEDTLCSACGKTVVTRAGYMIKENLLSSGSCPFCRAEIAGIW